MTIYAAIPIIAIAYSWLRLLGRGSRRVEGTPIAVRPIPLLARIYMQAVPAGAAILAAIVTALLDAAPWWLAVLAVASAIVLVAIPLRYTVTDRGARRTFGPFRRWTEFAGVARAPGGARLAPLPGSRPARVWLSGSRGDDEFLQTLRTLVRNAYKGKSEPAPMPVITPAGKDGTTSTPTLPNIAAFRKDA